MPDLNNLNPLPDDSPLRPGTLILRRLVSGGAWALSGKILAVIVGLAGNALLARLLTPTEMGAYFLIFSLVAISTVVAQLGLKQAVVRLIAESMATDRPERAGAAVRIAFRLGALGAFLAVGLLVGGVGEWLAHVVLKSTLVASSLVLAAVWVVVQTAHTLFAEVFRGFHDIRLASVFEAVVSGGLSSIFFAILLVVIGHSDLEQVLALWIVAALISAVVAGTLVSEKVKGLADGGELSYKEVVTLSGPLFISALLPMVSMYASLWILSAFRPQAEVAVYGAAVRLVTLVSVPLVILNSVAPPLIAEMYAQGRIRKLESVLRGSTTVAAIPALMILMVFILLAPNILSLVYGEYYVAGAAALVLLSLGHSVNVWAGPCGLLLSMTGHHIPVAIITAFCAVVSIAISLATVHERGALGVALGATVGLALQNFLLVIYGVRRLRIRTYATLSLEAMRF